MQLADRKYARHAQSGTAGGAMTVAVVRVLPADPNRTAIDFSAAGLTTNRIRLMIRDSAQPWAYIAATNPPYRVSIADHADAVRGEWFANTDAGTGVLLIGWTRHVGCDPEGKELSR